MRRGLMSWVRDEVPVAALESRVSRLQAGMRAAGLDAVVIHTSFARPAAVHWLTNFTPYWSEALLVVWPDGLPTMLAALTPRVHAWIREVAHLGELMSAPKLGDEACKLLSQRVGRHARIGVVAFDTLPWSVGEPLLQAFGAEQVVDASALFRSVRQPADDVEKALAKHAARIARDALDNAPRDAADTSVLAAAIESSARMAGAEEVLQRVAPVLDRDASPRRLEGTMALGDRYAIELSVAYKGVWTRLGRSIARRPDMTGGWDAAEAWFESACRATLVEGKSNDTSDLRDASNASNASDRGNVSAGFSTCGIELPSFARSAGSSWLMESSIGVDPLTIITSPLPAGSLCVVSAHLQTDNGRWFAAGPVDLSAQQGRTSP